MLPRFRNSYKSTRISRENQMLSMKAKYALKALIVLARHRDSQLQARAIAAEARIPPKFLEAILTELKNRGILDSRRGTAGGFRLARDARRIMAGDIIRMMDGPLAPIRCASLTAYRRCDDCPDEKSCTLHSLMQDVRAAMSGVLDKCSIRDLARNEPESLKGIS
jgi:Rrf2 family protein